MLLRGLAKIVLIMVSGCLFLANAQAAILIQETYDPYTTGAIDNKTVNATGLTGIYTNNNAGSLIITNGSLPFSTYTTSSGNRLVAASDGGATAVATMALPSALAAGSTLYGSYLVKLNSFGSTSAFVEVRIASAGSDTSGAARFRVLANGSNTNSNLVAARYDTTLPAAPAGATSYDASTGLALGTNYMLISRFTNVGTALSAGTPGVATVYALTAAQYDNLALQPNLDAFLDSATVGTGSTNITARVTTPGVTSGTWSFASGNFLQSGIIGYNGVTAEYDEIRFGTTLSDVTGIAAIPEPTGLALGVLGLASTGIFWLRRRNSQEVLV